LSDGNPKKRKTIDLSGQTKEKDRNNHFFRTRGKPSGGKKASLRSEHTNEGEGVLKKWVLHEPLGAQRDGVGRKTPREYGPSFSKELNK